MLQIRKYYQPIQPSISSGIDDVCYQEFLPHSSLQHLIFCYWSLHSQQPLAMPFQYRVVADACIDLLFPLDNPHQSFAVGFSPHHTTFPLGHAFHYIGIRFFPTAFPRLFHIKAFELTGNLAELASIAATTAKFIELNFAPEHSIGHIQKLLNEHFMKKLAATQLISDNRLFAALDIVLKKRGNLSIEHDLDVGLSKRQLRRLFDFYVGTNAKSISKIIRFQTLLNAKPSASSLKQNKIYFDLGYYDQAHFIREFKQFFGATPNQAFRQ